MVSAKRVGPLFLRWFKIDFYVAILGLMALIFLNLASLPKALNTKSLYFCHDAAKFYLSAQLGCVRESPTDGGLRGTVGTNTIA